MIHRKAGPRFGPIFLVALLSLACFAEVLFAAETDAPSQDTNSESVYKLGPQNLIQIKIFGEAGVNQIYSIDEGGYITHALVGRIKLGGLSVVEVEQLMEQKLAGDYIINPQVTVFVLQHSRFSVLGEVRKPGTYEIMGRVSIIEAISMAGGFTPVASQGNVKIIRKSEGGESSINVDTTRITRHGDLEANVYMEADDVVVVSKSFF